MIGLKNTTHNEKYVIVCRYYATAEIEVLANSEKEANEKADQVELSPEDFVFDFIDSEISEAEEVPELSDMIERTGKILDRFSKEKDDEVYIVPAYPIVTTNIWDGREIKKVRNLIEDFYWDKETSELILTSEDQVDISLSELSEAEQHKVCSMIIDAAPANGISL